MGVKGKIEFEISDKAPDPNVVFQSLLDGFRNNRYVGSWDAVLEDQLREGKRARVSHGVRVTPKEQMKKEKEA